MKRRINRRQFELQRVQDFNSLMADIELERADTRARLGEKPYTTEEVDAVLPDRSNWFGRATKKVGNFLFGENDNAGFFDRAKAVAENPSGAWHGFHQQRLGIKLTHDASELNEARSRQHDLELAQNYSDLVNEEASIRTALLSGSNLSNEDKKKLEQKHSDVTKQLSDISEYIKTEGKNSPILSSLFFDPNLVEWTGESGKKILSHNLWIPENLRDKKWYDVPGAVQQAVGVVENLVRSGASMFDKLVPESLGGSKGSDFTMRAIRESDPADRTYDSLFDDKYDIHGNPKTDRLNASIKELRQQYQREVDEKRAALTETINDYTNGNWLFNPKKIDPNFKKIRDNINYGLIGGIVDPTKWAFGFTELGSSWSDFEHFASLLATDAAANVATKGLLKAATKFNPYATLFEGAATVVSIAAQPAQVYLTAELRRNETASEAMDAYSQRVLQESIQKGVNLKKVLEETEQYSKQLGINTEGLDQIQMLQLALAYNTPTSDDGFEQIKKDARKGIQKLVNDNNSLAAMDYLQALPFMNYTRGYLADVARTRGSRVGNVIKDMKNASSAKDMTSNIQYYTNDLYKRMATNPELAEAMGRSANGMIDNVINKAAVKLFSNKVNQTKFAHAADFIASKFERALPLALSESSEEGVQHLLQQRYLRGEYDNDRSDTRMLSIQDMFDDAKLSLESAAAYLGLNFGDPDNGSQELRKAMEIGAMTGMFFSAPHLLSNVLSKETLDKLENVGVSIDPRNTRNLIRQLKNDNVINTLVGENYRVAQDDEHARIFFDAYDKAGHDVDGVVEALNRLASIDGTLDKGKYVQRDIDIAKDVWEIYNNHNLDKLLSKVGAKRGDQTHKDFVTLAVRASEDFKTNLKLLNESIRDVNEQRKQLLDDILYGAFESEQTEDGQIRIDRSTNLAQQLDDIYQFEKERYQRKLDEHRANVRKSDELRDLLLSRAQSNVQNRIGTDEQVRLEDVQSELDSLVANITDEELDQLVPYEKIASKEDVAIKLVTDAIQYRKNKVIDSLKEQWEDQYELLRTMRQETGTDVNLEKTRSIIKHIDDEKTSTTDVPDFVVEIADNLGKRLDDALRHYILNSAAYAITSPIYEAYTNGRVNPNDVEQQIKWTKWSDLTKEQKDFYIQNVEDDDSSEKSREQLAREKYESLMRSAIGRYSNARKNNKASDKPYADQTYAERQKIRNAEEDTALALIQMELAARNKRRLTAHKEYVEQVGATPNTIEAAENNDSVAQEVIDNELNVDQQPVQNDVVSELNDDIKEQLAVLDQESTDKESQLEQQLGISVEEDATEQDALFSSMLESGKVPDLISNTQLSDEQEVAELSTELGQDPIEQVKNWAKDLTLGQIINLNDGQLLLRSVDGETKVELRVSNKQNTNEAPTVYTVSIVDNEGKPVVTFSQPVGYSTSDGSVVEDIYTIQYDLANMNAIIVNGDIVLSNRGTELTSDQIKGEDQEDHSDTDTGQPLSHDVGENYDEESQAAIEEYQSEELQPTEESVVVNEDVDDSYVVDPSQNDGELSIEVSQLEVEDGTIVVNNHALDDDTLEVAIEEQESLQTSEDLSQETSFNPYTANRKHKKTNRSDVTSDQNAVYEYLSSTFFYQPQPRTVKLEDGSTVDETPRLTINGQDIKLKYKLGSGRQLAKKLLDADWLSNIHANNKAYYIVTRNKKAYKPTDDSDQFTIALILEDDTDKICYATFLRQPGKYTYINSRGEEQTVDGLSQIKGSLRKIGVDDSLYEEAEANVIESAYSIQRSSERRPNPDKMSPIQYQTQLQRWKQKAKSWFQKLDQDDELKRELLYQIRLESSRNKNVLTEDQIDENIAQLRNARRVILDVYCTKDKDGNYILPDNIRTDVYPQQLLQSDGKFANMRDENSGLPIYKNLTENKQYGLSDDVQTLSKQLQNGEFKFGIGTGAFSFVPFEIFDLINENEVYDAGDGRSGKIYFMVNGASGKTKAIQLRESRFSKQYTTKGEVVNIKSEKDVTITMDSAGNITNTEYKPSAAEVVLHLICGKLNRTQNIFARNKQTLDSFAHFVVNYDSSFEDARTLLDSNLSIQNQFPFFSQKQLLFAYSPVQSQMVLMIGDVDEQGNHFLKEYKESELFPKVDTEDSIANRKHVIYLIGKNMHWNTNVEQMRQDNGFISGALWFTEVSKYFAKHPKEKQYSLFGLPEFTFNREDFIDNNGQQREGVNTAAFLLKNGKLLTDVSPQLFEAPYVFAEGVYNEDSKVDQQIPSVNENQKDLAQAVANNVESYQRTLAKIYGKKVDPNDRVLSNEEAKQKWLDSLYKDSDVRQQHGNAVDDVLLDLGTQRIKTADQLMAAIESAIAKYKNANIGSKYADNLKVDYFGDLTDLKNNPMSTVLIRTINQWAPRMVVFEDGYAVVTNIKNIDTNSMTKHTGVYSTVRGTGKLDISKARQWLAKSLGLDPTNVVVLTLLKGMHNQDTFGVLEMSLDSIYNKIVPTISLRKDSGVGVHYHEAWHYVNLLMHTKEQRNVLYDAYVEQHPQYKKAKNSEVEEAMAEDFRQYMELYNELPIKNIFKRVYNNILDLVIASRRKSIIRRVFNDIKSGRYKNVELDSESVEEFKKLYPNGVNMADFITPVTEQSTVEKFTSIVDYHTFYQVGVSLAHRILDSLQITTVSELKRAAGKNVFDFVLKQLEKELSLASPEQKGIIKDVINNPQAFRHIISGLFKQYGIEPKFKRVSTENGDAVYIENGDDSLAKDTGAQKDFTYDIDKIKISKKDNAGFRAKLFLSQLQDAIYVINPTTGEKEYVPKHDTILNSPIYVPFSKAWNVILTNLYDIETYAELEDDGTTFKSTSLRGKLEKLAKNDPILNSLKIKLDRLEDIGGDIELENQVFSTIKSAFNQIASLQLSDPVVTRKYVYEESDTMSEIQPTSNQNFADRERKWVIQNSNSLRARFQLPKRWSKTAVISGMVTYDESTQKSHISKPFVEHVNQLLLEIKGLLRTKLFLKQYGGSRLTSILDKDASGESAKKLQKGLKKQELFVEAFDVLQTNIDEAKRKIVDLLHYMGVSADLGNETLDHYISNQIPEDQAFENPIRQAEILTKFLSEKSGQFGFISKMLTSAAKDSSESLKLSKKAQLNFEEVFTRNDAMKSLAESYNQMHPQSSEFSIFGPDGAMIYPINQNNYMSDAIRWLNSTSGKRAADLRKCPYSTNSLVLKIASQFESFVPQSLKFKLNRFVGLRDINKKEGNDYLKITPLEDYISKMIMTLEGDQNSDGMLILPTMADKTTWYAISHPKIPKFRNALTRENTRFNVQTLNIFGGYLLDEISALEQYYDHDNIQSLINDPNKLRINFHGQIVDGRLDFSGNGGKFRYFYDVNLASDVDLASDVNPASKNRMMNLNQLLQFEYERQKLIEANPTKYGGIGQLRQLNKNKKQELDGFELVRETLKQIRSTLFEGNVLTEAGENGINSQLVQLVDKELQRLSKPGSMHMVDKDENTGLYSSYAIPTQILQIASELLNTGTHPYDYRNEPIDDHNLVLTAIGNHVAATMMSIIEFEKVFSGDPAYYKWKNGNKTTITKKYNEGTRNEYSVSIDVDNIVDKFADKIKRLGAVLSPGSNLRLDYSKEIISQFPELADRNYTNMNIEDAEVKSKFVDYLKERFERQLVADYMRTEIVNGSKEFTQKDINDTYFAEKSVYKTLYDKLPSFVKANITKSVKRSSNPYTKINVSDAQVIIRPSLYRKIRIALGQWSFIPDDTGYSDEDAYNILEGSDNLDWLSDSELNKVVSKLQLYPLKMTYFMHDPSTHVKNGHSNVPVYNKMAIFPMFRYMSNSSTGRQLYERMNGLAKDKDGNTITDIIDMISFDSAVKVGGVQRKYKPFEIDQKELDHFNEGLNRSNKELNVQTQSLDGLRMQLNTEAHEDNSRPIGTQMFKIAFSNIIDDSQYGESKRYGSDIKAHIIKAINALTVNGAKRLNSRYFNDDHTPNQKAARKLIKEIIQNNGLGVSAEQIIGNGGVAASLMSRKIFEHGASAKVNKEVVDINTKGGSAIQQSIFGLVGAKGKDNDMFNTINYNDGKELNWNREDGSVEVLLSQNFFEAIVPSNIRGDYNAMRKWLFENNIIGTNAKPLGIAYRIPTQGMSSMIAITVVDMLPKQSGDLIIVPREFTAQTGSDYDVDKLYIATMSYKNGEFEQWDEEDEDASDGAIANALLRDYIDIITDVQNYSDARASIDVITKLIKEDLLPLLEDKSDDNSLGGSELLPSFQALRKMEFSVGKDGIGPFALNITNLALTQFTHLTMDFGDNEFDLGKLDEIRGEDGRYISSWLSAMVNAHVDVAKDPYIFTLNVNQATYNHVNLLLRAGKGIRTFVFIAQPILKQYADEVNNVGGSYGRNIDGRSITKNSNFSKKKAALYKLLNDVIINTENAYKNLSKEEKAEILKYCPGITTVKTGAKKSIKPDWNLCFDDFMQNALTIKNKIDSKEATNLEVAEYWYAQLIALKSYEKLNPFAEELSQLVKASQVDTKKFGNTIALQYNFVNEYEKFLYGKHNVVWKTQSALQTNETPVESYAKQLYIDTKLRTATYYTRSILRPQLYTATPVFLNVLQGIFRSVYGTVQIQANGKKYYRWEKIYNDDSVQHVANAIDDVFRYRVLKNSRYIASTGDDISLTENGNIQSVRDRFSRILFGDKNAEEEYERNSLFVNLAKFIKEIQEDPYSSKAQGLVGSIDSPNAIINELLNFLSPQPATKTNPIGRLLLHQSQMNTADLEKMTMVSAFGQLLTHEDPYVRRLAEDLVFYAYYSTYNTSTPNSFFDLVPASFRKSYDDALKEGLLLTSEELLCLISDRYADGIEAVADDVFDIIARNYWYDENIVPVYKMYEKRSKSLAKTDAEIRVGESWKTPGNNRIHGAIITSYANNKYIKTQFGDEVTVYRRIGVITQQSAEGGVVGNPKYIYVAVPKLGAHYDRQHHYEFFNDGSVSSIFEENKLPDIFKTDILLQNIKKEVDSATPEKGCTFVVHFENGLSTSTFSEQNYFKYIAPKQLAYHNNDNTMRFILSGNGDLYCKDNSNVVIDVDSDKHSDSEKTVKISISQNVTDVVKKIQKILSPQDSVKTPLSLYISGEMSSLKLSKQDIENAKEGVTYRYREYLLYTIPEISEQQLQEQVEQYLNSEEFDSVVRQQAQLDKSINYFDNLIQQLVVEGYKINTIYTLQESPVGRSVAFAAQRNQSDIENANKVYVVLNKNEYGGKDSFEKIHKLIDQQFSVTYEESSEKQDDVQDIQQVVESATDAMEFVGSLNDVVTQDQEQLVGSELQNSTDFGDEIIANDAENAIDVLDILQESSKEEESDVQQFTSSRYANGNPNYEVSTAGDSRFSAIKTKFAPGTIMFNHDVGGRTIESVYQHGVKQGDWVTDNNKKTGAPKDKTIITGNTEQDSYIQGYLPLWQKWAEQNPELISELRSKASGKVLTDKYASTYVSQARALADILNASQKENKVHENC